MKTKSHVYMIYFKLQKSIDDYFNIKRKIYIEN